MIADISSNVIIEVEHLAMKINPKKTSRPTQFLLYADLQMTNTGVYGWRFVLESLSGSLSVEASDVEPGTDGERLELLAVVRALESLDQPSEVVLLTPSRYVVRGLRHGLDAWRESSWCWERFGRMVPIKNADLWERIDRALSYHQVRCRRASMRVLSEATVDGLGGPEVATEEQPELEPQGLAAG